MFRYQSYRWSFIEYLVAATVLGVVLAVIIPQYQLHQQKKYDLVRANVYTVNAAVKKFAESNDKSWPMRVNEALSDGRTLASFLPDPQNFINPFTKRPTAIHNGQDLDYVKAEPGDIYYYRAFGCYELWAYNHKGKPIAFALGGSIVLRKQS